jgi:putative transposase
MKKERLLSKEQAKAFIREHDLKEAKDVQGVLKDIFGEILQEMVEGELEQELGYSKYNYKNKETDNSRNGFSKKRVKSSLGEIDLDMARDRNGEFEPVVVKKHQKDVSSIEDSIISMYAKGMSTRDIHAQMEEIYGIDVSADMVSRITDKILPVVREWQNRSLEDIYSVIYLDGMFFSVKQDGSTVKKTAYIIIGYDLQGNKDILGIWISESESAKFWLGILNELKNRGVKDVLIASIDGLAGFETAIKTVFSECEVQRCIVHQIRNSTKFVNYKDLKQFTQDMKSIYKAPTEEAALEALEEFSDKWNSKYPYAIKSWYANWDSLSTFFKYPQEIRTLIYTTNPIESFNSAVKRRTKTKGAFPSDDSLLKLIYLAAMDVSKKWTQKHRDWSLIIGQLSIYFEKRVDGYI